MKMFVKKNPVTMVPGLLLALAGNMLAVPAPAVRAAPLSPMTLKAEARIVEDGVEPATTSRVLSLTLPEGANRLTSADELAKFDQELQEAARTLNGTVTRFEVLVWSGDAAKAAVGQLSARLKEMGYTTGEPTTFNTEAGRVTPVGALRGDKSDSVMGTWIETKEGIALLIWGRFKPDAASASDVAAKPTAVSTKTAAVPNKAADKQKKVSVAAKPKSGKSPASSPNAARPETDAERQAKAYKAYQDYQYVKMMGPISGPMYRSTKW